MTNTKNTKRALVSSILALVLCVSMLIGSTFAWFTESVTSAGNKIVSGTLDIDLFKVELKEDWMNHIATGDYFNRTEITDSTAPLFGDDILWEPGYTEVVSLELVNNGNLALKYQAVIRPITEVGKLAEVIDVYVNSSVLNPGSESREEYIAAATKIGTLKDVLSGGAIAEGEMKKSGDDVQYFSIILKMREEAGNEYQGETAGVFDITVLATQLTCESDSFDDQYDKDATYPLGKNTQAIETYTATEDGVDFTAKVEIPAEAPDGKYDIVLSEPEDIVFTNDNGNATMAFDLKLTRTVDGVTEEVTNSGLSYPVVISLPNHFVDVKKVYHNGNEVTDFVHDKGTNTVRFTTTHFSPFEIVYTDYTDPSFELDYTTDGNGQYTITKGIFVKKNPVEFDASLAKQDSEYMVVDFVKDGVKRYAVSKRASTVLIAPDATVEYSCESGKYSVMSGQSGKLWNVLSGLQSNRHSTVYLLPGTYNEGTTINVYSSMDIIGLGDTDKIKVVKTSSSSSNRHLFNCNGSQAQYIHVTLRNMTLDATAKTTNNKDNAAVQSIRKSKVKCYDLDIIKGTSLDAVSLYVNGNNAVDGVKYTAYLYAENCSLNVTREYGVVSTAATYKFYHSGLTYNGGTTYTKNSGSIKNVVLAADDWDW